MKFWHRLFLDERPSLMLGFFRIAVALTMGFHVLPTFCHLDDNYFHTAFKTFNTNFFPVDFVALVQKSPDSVVVVFVWIFCLSWFAFLIGLWTQVSCCVLMAASYYFYALNAFHIGTLSWDILLVTMFLMCVTPFPGDYFSVDSLRRGRVDAYKKCRPFFVQRLMQMQIAWTYFYTALYKVTAEGNWLKGNPLYCLMHYPSEGVTKYFLLRDFLMHHPHICYCLGVVIVVIEFLMPVLLFVPATRLAAIILGFIFHITLILTLDVPAIFFFLFPAQLLLFINPKDIVESIDAQREYYSNAKKIKVLFDGKCQFCRGSVRVLEIMDMFGKINFVDIHSVDHWDLLHPNLSKKNALSQIHAIDTQRRIWGGFKAFRRIAWEVPMLYPILLFMYLPGMTIVGEWCYRLVANNRYLLHNNKICSNNSCFGKL